MRAVWNAIAVLLLLNVLVLAGAALWLYNSGRLNRERIDKVLEVFRLTVEQEEAELELAAEVAQQAREVGKEQVWLESVKAGPRSVEGRMNEDRRAVELTLHLNERARRDRKAFLENMAKYRQIITRQEAELNARRQQIDRVLAEQKQRRESEDFKKAVAIHEQGKPKQTKRIFMDLIKQGDITQVIEYLAAMQTRKAVAVLKEFKNDTEITQARLLIEGLRTRGVDLLTNQAKSRDRTNDG